MSLSRRSFLKALGCLTLFPGALKDILSEKANEAEAAPITIPDEVSPTNKTVAGKLQIYSGSLPPLGVDKTCGTLLCEMDVNFKTAKTDDYIYRLEATPSQGIIAHTGKAGHYVLTVGDFKKTGTVGRYGELAVYNPHMIHGAYFNVDHMNLSIIDTKKEENFALKYRDYQHDVSANPQTSDDIPPCFSCNEMDYIKCRDGESDSGKCKIFNRWTDSKSEYRKAYRQGLRGKANA